MQALIKSINNLNLCWLMDTLVLPHILAYNREHLLMTSEVNAKSDVWREDARLKFICTVLKGFEMKWIFTVNHFIV